jgi:hypothetical protein
MRISPISKKLFLQAGIKTLLGLNTMISKICGLLLSIFLTTLSYGNQQGSKHRIIPEELPNIVLIFADDMGYADIIGYSLGENEGEDSFSFLPLLLNEESGSIRAPVILHSGNGMYAIRDNKWKMVFGNGSRGRKYPLESPGRSLTLFLILKLIPARQQI